MAQKPYSLSVVMPAYNEEEIIEKVIRRVCGQILENFENPEFVIVNDCSKDRTLSIIEKMKKEYPYIKIISNEQNQGHGPSLMKGYAAARGEYVFFLDSDNQIPIKQFWLLWENMEKESWDIITGIRKKREDPGYRLFISRILQLFNRIIFGAKIRDINCPFKLYRGKALQQVLTIVPQNTGIPSILMLLFATQLKLKLGEVEITHLPRTTGKSLMRNLKILKLGWKSILELVRFKIHLNQIK